MFKKKKLVRLSFFLLTVAFFVALESVFFKPHNIDWFFERVFIEYGFEEPELMSRLKIFDRYGIKFFNGKIKDISETNKSEAYKDLIVRNMDLLTSYRRSGLTEQQRLSADILHRYLENEIYRFSVHKDEYLANHVSGLHIKFPEFMIEVHDIENLWDAEAYVSRLSHYAKNIENLREIMDIRETEEGVIPPKFIIRRVIEQLKSFVNNPVEFNILYMDFKYKIGKSKNISEIGTGEMLYEVRSIIEDELKPSYQRLIEHLERMETRANDESSIYVQPGGTEYYSYMMKIYSNSDSTIEEIYNIGQAEVQFLTTQTDSLLRDSGIFDAKKSIPEHFALLDKREHFYSEDSLGYSECYGDMKKIIKETLDFLPKIFPVRELPQHFVIKQPNISFLERDALLTFKKIENDTIVFSVNPENIRLTPKHELRYLIYGECVGIFLQKILEERIENLPTFRKTLDFEGFLDAWKLYAQRLCYEKGYFTNPYEKLSFLRHELLLSASIVADIGLHAKKWKREQAVDYLYGQTGLNKNFLTEEVDKFAVLPAKAVTAKMGQVRMRDLKKFTEKKLGSRFNSEEFDFFIIRNGQMPISVLNKLVLEFIKNKKQPQSAKG